MKNVLKFIEKYGLLILLVLIVMNTCSNSMTKKQTEKKFIVKLDSIQTELIALKKEMTIEIKKEIKLEGLKTELRMIESTDRRMMDKNRQSEIRKELEKIK